MTEHYFSEQQHSSFTVKPIEVVEYHVHVTVFTAPGVFSPKKIDKGTSLLLQHAMIDGAKSLLDLGCGYGVVGLVLAKAFPELQVTLADVNERALMLAGKGKAFNKLGNVVVKKSNAFASLPGSFDVIVLNPPQSAGKTLCFRMIEESLQHLHPGGSLQLVARHNKGGKSFMLKMQDVFGNAEAIAKQGGYRVYMSRKKV